MHNSFDYAGFGHAGRVKILPYLPEHLLAIDEQEAESYWGQVQTPEYASELHSAGPAYTAMRDDGTVLCCAGVIVHWECRALAWAVMARRIGADYVTVHRAVCAFLDSLPYRRIELTVDCGFRAGIRWAEMLGFVNETPNGMQCYGPDGRAHYQYARIK